MVAAADDSAVFGRRGEVLAMAGGRMMQAGSDASSAAAAEGDAVVGGVQPFGLTRFAFALGSCTVWELKIVLHVLHLKKREEKGLSFREPGPGLCPSGKRNGLMLGTDWISPVVGSESQGQGCAVRGRGTV